MNLAIKKYFETLNRNFANEEHHDLIVQHDPETEALPEHPIFHEDFHEVARLVNEEIQKLRDTILGWPNQNAESRYQLERLHAVRSPEYPPPHMVAHFGDSGVGKSTLNNAVLGDRNLSFKVS
jgi:hypothetical protein